jgi:hypothetical protein
MQYNRNRSSLQPTRAYYTSSCFIRPFIRRSRLVFRQLAVTSHRRLNPCFFLQLFSACRVQENHGRDCEQFIQIRADKRPWAGGGFPHTAQFPKTTIPASPQKVIVNKNNNHERIFLFGIEFDKEYLDPSWDQLKRYLDL